MTPYMSFLLPPFKTTLANFEVGTSENQVLWASIIDIISKTFSYDEGSACLVFGFSFVDLTATSSILA
jgi:hypothetical protein